MPLFLMALSLALGCASQPNTSPTPYATATSTTPQPTLRPTPEPTPPPTITVSAANLTGVWAVGEDMQAMAKAPVPYCWSDWVWELDQKDAQVTGKRSLNVLSPSMAIKLAPPAYVEFVNGTNVAGRLELTGGVYQAGTSSPTGSPLETVAYRLAYDPTNHRLIGTRNDKPFWAVIGTPGRDISEHPGSGMPAYCI